MHPCHSMPGPNQHIRESWGEGESERGERERGWGDQQWIRKKIKIVIETGALPLSQSSEGRGAIWGPPRPFGCHHQPHYPLSLSLFIFLSIRGWSFEGLGGCSAASGPFLLLHPSLFLFFILPPLILVGTSFWMLEPSWLAIGMVRHVPSQALQRT